MGRKTPAGVEHRGPTWERLMMACRWDGACPRESGACLRPGCQLQGLLLEGELCVDQACTGEHETWGAKWVSWGLGSRLLSMGVGGCHGHSERAPHLQAGGPVHKCQSHQQHLRQPNWVSASFSRSPACERWHSGWQASSAAGGPASDCLKETKLIQVKLKPVRRPQREPLSSRDCSQKTRPLPSARLGPWLCECHPPPPWIPAKPRALNAARRALINSPSPAGRSCFLFPCKRFVPGHKFCRPSRPG